MAACESLKHIFDQPLETPKPPFDSSVPSWKHVTPIKSVNDSCCSFSDMFSELHFSGNNDYSASSMKQTKLYQRKVGMNSESLSMCTEGLGFESFDDVEDLRNKEDVNDRCKQKQEEQRQSFDFMKKHVVSEMVHGELKRSRIKGTGFPPPISSIGRSGKPWVYLKSYRSNGRFILKEVKIPTQELLHACREDGRLKLQFIQSDDEALCEEDEDEDGELEERQNGDEVSNKDYVKIDTDGDDDAIEKNQSRQRVTIDGN